MPIGEREHDTACPSGVAPFRLCSQLRLSISKSSSVLVPEGVRCIRNVHVSRGLDAVPRSYYKNTGRLGHECVSAIANTTLNRRAQVEHVFLL